MLSSIPLGLHLVHDKHSEHNVIRKTVAYIRSSTFGLFIPTYQLALLTQDIIFEDNEGFPSAASNKTVKISNC